MLRNIEKHRYIVTFIWCFLHRSSFKKKTSIFLNDICIFYSWANLLDGKSEKSSKNFNWKSSRTAVCSACRQRWSSDHISYGIRFTRFISSILSDSMLEKTTTRKAFDSFNICIWKRHHILSFLVSQKKLTKARFLTI